MSGMHERALRMSTLVRGTLIAYGVALFSWFFSSRLPQDESSGLLAIGVGLGLQAFVLIARVLAKRRAESSAYAMYVIELIADAITVAIFAISTFGAIARMSASI